MCKKKMNFLLIFLFIGFVVAISIIKINENSIFTQEKWAKEPNKRYLIVENMLEKYNFDKMTRTEVRRLLGKSDEKYYGFQILPRLNKKPINEFDTNSIFYFIEKGEIVTPEEVSGFYVRFDDDSKVIDYAILEFTT